MEALSRSDLTRQLVTWTKAYFIQNGPDAPAVLGVSGGKDSNIMAALLSQVVGPQRLYLVAMPDGTMEHRSLAEELAEYLRVPLHIIPIDPITTYQRAIGEQVGVSANQVALWNNPARIRMSILYYIANCIGGRVANTCNLSETYVGYDTKWGDQCGDFSPFKYLTATEVKGVGTELCLPHKFVEVAPSDGLCGLTDEQRWGFTYQELDHYLRGGEVDPELALKIETMHNAAYHKNSVVSLPAFGYCPQGSRNLC